MSIFRALPRKGWHVLPARQPTLSVSLSLWFSFGRPLCTCLCRSQFAVTDLAFRYHTTAFGIHEKSWEIVGYRFLIRPLPKAKFVFAFSSWGCGLISFKICSTWTQMTVNDSCGTLHTVCRAFGMARGPAVNARCLPFCKPLIKLPEGSNWRKPLVFSPDKTLKNPHSRRP